MGIIFHVLFYTMNCNISKRLKLKLSFISLLHQFINKTCKKHPKKFKIHLFEIGKKMKQTLQKLSKAKAFSKYLFPKEL
jgi:hypothetical protein